MRYAGQEAMSRMGSAVNEVTRLLAEMQTSIIAAGMRSFRGDVDRFAIFSLIVRETLQRDALAKAISTHSLAISLSRSFETVRRHVIAMTDAGLCVRGRSGVMVRADVLERPDVAALMRLSHDSFVRLTDGLVRLGGLPVVTGPMRVYDSHVGIAAAIDVMLATVDSNRAIHHDWLDLVLFSTILHANMQRRAQTLESGDLSPTHAVRAGVIARALSLPDTTVRRRLTRLTSPGGPVLRLRQGFLVSERWLESEDARETSRRTYTHIRLVVTNAAAQGFPVNNPTSAYLEGPPPADTFA